MWQTQLTLSYQQLILSAVFYGTLAVYSVILCWRYDYLVLSLPLLIVLLFEYRRSYRYFSHIIDDFAIHVPVRQIYWQQQRWLITRKPLFLHYWVIIHVKSLRSGKRCCLWLSSDHFSRPDWRSFCYYLHCISDSF